MTLPCCGRRCGAARETRGSKYATPRSMPVSFRNSRNLEVSFVWVEAGAQRQSYIAHARSYFAAALCHQGRGQGDAAALDAAKIHAAGLPFEHHTPEEALILGVTRGGGSRHQAMPPFFAGCGKAGVPREIQAACWPENSCLQADQ